MLKLQHRLNYTLLHAGEACETRVKMPLMFHGKHFRALGDANKDKFSHRFGMAVVILAFSQGVASGQYCVDGRVRR